jgi:hypothetical protein
MVIASTVVILGSYEIKFPDIREPRGDRYLHFAAKTMTAPQLILDFDPNPDVILSKF